uniref:Chromosome 11 open reading frame 86 n=2 Tax=Lynx canadensis TaxID=61383 RepID=A0A667HJN4_LYNCA
PRPSYGKLQEPWGKPLESRLRRALSLRQGQEKSRPSNGGPERLDTPGQEWLPGCLEDTEQLIQAQQGERRRRWLKQYQQQVKRRWESFVSGFPGVTLSRPSLPRAPSEHHQLRMLEAASAPAASG